MKFRNIFTSSYWGGGHDVPSESLTINEELSSVNEAERIEIAIALVKRINMPAILHSDSYFFYSDLDDLFNDVVIFFTIFTFVFATWGECRDRRKRLYVVERRSRMTASQKERARLLQVEFRSQTVR